MALIMQRGRTVQTALLASTMLASPVMAADYLVNSSAAFQTAVAGISTSTDKNHSITFTSTVSLAAAPGAIYLKAGDSLTINGGGYTINGSNSYRPFLILNKVDAGASYADGPRPGDAAATVTISNLTITNGKAQGGDSELGGGGMGAGGAMFIGDKVAATLSTVSFSGNAAVGGSTEVARGLNGGGGLGSGGGGTGGGGGGAGADPLSGGGSYNGASGGPGGGSGGLRGTNSAGGDGGFGAGGGQSNYIAGGPAVGGKGGFGGGGGQSYGTQPSDTGGAGGFGGGGGNGYSGQGGAGGFGGGGGGGGNSGGLGGFGGGNGGNRGGSGAGFGGAIFVMAGGSLTITGPGSMDGGSVKGGVPRFLGPNAGLARGTGLFLQSSGVTLAPEAGQTITINDIIADNTATGIPASVGTAGSGTGTVTKSGFGTLYLNGVNTYTGDTTVNAGILGGTGTLAGKLYVNGGSLMPGAADGSGTLTVTGLSTIRGTGILGGTGTLAGNVTVASGGTLQPGSARAPQDTFTIGGNLTLGSGSTYAVALNGASTAKTQVNGTATLGGATLRLTGNYISGTKYTVLSSAKAVNGSFGTVDKSALGSSVIATMDYGNRDVAVTLTASGKPGSITEALGTSAAVDPRNVALALDNATGNITGLSPITSQSGAALARGLQSLSGDIHTDIAPMGLRASRQFGMLMRDHKNAAVITIGGDEALQMSRVTRSSPNMARKGVTPGQPGLSVWTAAYGNGLSLAADAGIGTTARSSMQGHLAFGIEGPISPNATLGIAASFGAAQTTSAAASKDSANAGIYQLGAYLHQSYGKTQLSAALSYGLFDVTTSRDIPWLGQRGITSRHRAHFVHFDMEASHAVWAYGGLTVSPLVAMGLTGQFSPAYRESGNSVALLSVAAAQRWNLHGEAGLRLDYTMPGTQSRFFLRTALGYDTSANHAISATMPGISGVAFVTEGTRQGRWSVPVDIGAEVALSPRAKLMGAFNGQFSQRATELGGSVRLGIKF